LCFTRIYQEKKKESRGRRGKNEKAASPESYVRGRGEGERNGGGSGGRGKRESHADSIKMLARKAKRVGKRSQIGEPMSGSITSGSVDREKKDTLGRMRKKVFFYQPDSGKKKNASATSSTPKGKKKKPPPAQSLGKKGSTSLKGGRKERTTSANLRRKLPCWAWRKKGPSPWSPCPRKSLVRKKIKEKIGSALDKEGRYGLTKRPHGRSQQALRLWRTETEGRERRPRKGRKETPGLRRLAERD